MPAHRWSYPVRQLPAESLRRAGHRLTSRAMARLDDWRRGLAEEDVVVDYCPHCGFLYVARDPLLDDDLIRRPGHDLNW